MKEATSRNVTNLQQALNVQQVYTTTLCTHINAILTRVTKLERDIQLLTKKVTIEQDTVQIDAPDFDPDIDTQWAHNTAVISVHDLFNSPEPDQVDASSAQEESLLIWKIPIVLTISPYKF